VFSYRVPPCSLFDLHANHQFKQEISDGKAQKATKKIKTESHKIPSRLLEVNYFIRLAFPELICRFNFHLAFISKLVKWLLPQMDD